MWPENRRELFVRTGFKISFTQFGGIQMVSMQFNGKTALISGAGSGIGLELAINLGERGATIVGTDIDSKRVEGMLNILENKGIKAIGYTVDHGNLSDVESLFQKVKSDVGPVDVLCCNAGVGHSGKIGSIPLEEWKWVMDVNLWGVIYLVHFFVPSMIERKQGHVLITSSGAGLFPVAGMAPYCATKTAVFTLANIMRMELNGHNINVTALCPGIINTNIIKDGKIQGANNLTFMDKFYTKWGAHPSNVAKAAVKALQKNKGIALTPRYHVMTNYLLYRLSPTLIVGLGRLLFKRGWNFIGPTLKN
jgi:short-subunit dehydrogenase